ncbi:hypothetical protein MRB53_028852 [Persea americana]|uniref:Uncharacterized protein n=1 Tax=Persea americana TaxID=3435 RepID=A0ACC2KHG4_PERAE|nr:hypothetical protein MRB53_028852 [Persea americana]
MKKEPSDFCNNSDSRQRSKSSASSKLGSWILARDSLQIRKAPEDDCDLAGVSQSFCEECVREDEGGLHLSFLQQDGRVNALCSTPSIYTDAKYAANPSWPLKTDDFFPLERADAFLLLQWHVATKLKVLQAWFCVKSYWIHPTQFGVFRPVPNALKTQAFGSRYRVDALYCVSKAFLDMVMRLRKRTATRRAPSTDSGKPSDGALDSLRALVHTMVLQQHQMMEALQRMAPLQPELVLRSTPQLQPAPQQSPFVLPQPLHSFSLGYT